MKSPKKIYIVISRKCQTRNVVVMYDVCQSRAEADQLAKDRNHSDTHNKDWRVEVYVKGD